MWLSPIGMYSNYVDHKASSGTHGSAKAVYSFSYTQSIDDLVTHKYFLLVRAHLMQTCSHFSSVCLYLNHDYVYVCCRDIFETNKPNKLVRARNLCGSDF